MYLYKCVIYTHKFSIYTFFIYVHVESVPWVLLIVKLIPYIQGFTYIIITYCLIANIYGIP